MQSRRGLLRFSNKKYLRTVKTPLAYIQGVGAIIKRHHLVLFISVRSCTCLGLGFVLYSIPQIKMTRKIMEPVAWEGLFELSECTLQDGVVCVSTACVCLPLCGCECG